MTETQFQQFLVILTLSLLAALLFRRLAMTTIVAYLAVGALIGPFALGYIAAPEQFHFVAEFGVVFLLFSLGLEFNLKKMLALGKVVFGIGALQVLLCTAVFTAAVKLWGASLAASIIVAGSLALSSTAIVSRELTNNRELRSQHGQLAIGVLLFQDLVAVIFLILVPVLAQSGGNALWPTILQTGISAVLLIAILLAVGRYALKGIFAEVAKGNSEEIFVLTTLVIVLLAAWLTHSLGLSMPLGAFIVGMMLGEGPTRYQIESDIRPFKDILLGLFFVTIGMNLDLSLVPQHWLRLLVFTAGLLAIKTALVAVSVRPFGFDGRSALSVGINLAQAGEFGLALMALALVNGIVTAEEASFIGLIAIFSMALSPAMIRRATRISRRLVGDSVELKSHHLPEVTELKNHVLIGGFGRMGTLLAEFLELNQIPYLALETNIDVVEKYRRAGKNILYGNSNNMEILGRCQLKSARLIVLTFKSVEEGKSAIARIRNHNVSVPIIVRCQDHHNYQEMISLGADHVFPELLESSLLITRQVLEMLSVGETEIQRQVEDYLLRSALPAKPR